MIGVAASAVGREAGRGLLTLANVITVAVAGWLLDRRCADRLEDNLLARDEAR